MGEDPLAGKQEQAGTDQKAKGSHGARIMQVAGGIHHHVHLHPPRRRLIGALTRYRWAVAAALLAGSGGLFAIVAGQDPETAGAIPLVYANDTASWRCGDAVVVPGNVSAAGIQPPGERPSGGVSASNTGIGFTVQGNPGQTVELLDLKVDVVTKSAPLRGTRIPVVCQGDPPNRNLSANLDQRSPLVVKARPRPGDGGSTTDTGWPYTVSGDDPEHFVLYPTTQSYDVTFTLRLLWSWNGHSGELRIDDRGRPFRVTSDRYATRLCPDNDGSLLVPTPEAASCAG